MTKDDKTINDELDETGSWDNVKCARCGASPKEATLNIEGLIHHNTPVTCVEKKACRRRKRKKK